MGSASMRQAALRLLLLAGFAFVALPAGSASAGRLLITGHDADLHCSGGQQCHFVQVAASYVRGGAPDPTKPVLVLDRGSLRFVTALNSAFGAGAVPMVVMDPRSPQFAAEPLNTGRYSAILIASDITCGGCDLNESSSTPDSDAINARKNDISAFFNAGGGVYANSGARHGDGDPSTGADTYYSFLPLPVGGKPVQPPFCLTTDIGFALGLEDASGCPDASRHRGTQDDINCCATHNSFAAGSSALLVAEQDLGADRIVSADDAPETLIAQGVVKGGRLVQAPAAPVLGKAVNVEAVKGHVFVSEAAGGARASKSIPGLRKRQFVELTQATQIPVGSFLDTRKGTVKLTSARNSKGKTQSGKFSKGVFQVKQSRKKRLKGRTDLTLKGSSFSSCRSGGSSAQVSASRRRLSRRTIRKLSGSAKGRYRTSGRKSAATVRGTVWTMTDSCAGTLTSVKRGKVSVRDFHRRRTVTVQAGRSYLAR